MKTQKSQKSITCKMSNGPEFVCIGTQKGGTTALTRYLNTLDNVRCHSELHHFDECDKLIRKRGRIALSDDQYLSTFDQDESISGEVTPSYMLVYGALERLKKTCPDTKVIILLRNPIDRCISQYNMDKRKNGIDIDTAKMMNRLQQDIGVHHRDITKNGPYYIPRGYYDEQLEHVYNLYPEERIHVTISERFKHNTIDEMNKITNFIGCDSVDPSNSVFRKTVHTWKYDFVLSETQRVVLRDIYRPHIRRLTEIIDDNVIEWKDFLP